MSRQLHGNQNTTLLDTLIRHYMAVISSSAAAAGVDETTVFLCLDYAVNKGPAEFLPFLDRLYGSFQKDKVVEAHNTLLDTLVYLNSIFHNSQLQQNINSIDFPEETFNSEHFTQRAVDIISVQKGKQYPVLFSKRMVTEAAKTRIAGNIEKTKADTSWRSSNSSEIITDSRLALILTHQDGAKKLTQCPDIFLSDLLNMPIEKLTLFLTYPDDTQKIEILARAAFRFYDQLLTQDPEWVSQILSYALDCFKVVEIAMAPSLTPNNLSPRRATGLDGFIRYLNKVSEIVTAGFPIERLVSLDNLGILTVFAYHDQKPYWGALLSVAKQGPISAWFFKCSNRAQYYLLQNHRDYILNSRTPAAVLSALSPTLLDRLLLPSLEESRPVLTRSKTIELPGATITLGGSQSGGRTKRSKAAMPKPGEIDAGFVSRNKFDVISCLAERTGAPIAIFPSLSDDQLAELLCHPGEEIDRVLGKLAQQTSIAVQNLRALYEGMFARHQACRKECGQLFVGLLQNRQGVKELVESLSSKYAGLKNPCDNPLALIQGVLAALNPGKENCNPNTRRVSDLRNPTLNRVSSCPQILFQPQPRRDGSLNSNETLSSGSDPELSAKL